VDTLWNLTRQISKRKPGDSAEETSEQAVYNYLYGNSVETPPPLQGATDHLSAAFSFQKLRKKTSLVGIRWDKL